MQTPELLAPAGSPEALLAALRAGAGAIYLGYGDFNARRGAKNFTWEDLVAASDACRLRGVPFFLTLNTLVTDRELPGAIQAASQAVNLGVSAIIVQDLGLLTLLKQCFPDTPLHASTQMTIHNRPGLEFCRDLSLTRVVLSRELSLDALRTLSKDAPVELEVFLHGALCMSYSGQCYFSALLGGRSGNRGLCAQPCRLAYSGQAGEAPSYPLSLKDLSLAGQLETLSDLGISCLKLEGRMKRPEYVSLVTKIYADALREGREPTKDEEKTLEAAFSREGFTQGYFAGKKGPEMLGRRAEGERMSEALLEQARAIYTGKEAPTVPLSFQLTARLNAPVSLRVWDGDGNSATLPGPVPEMARNRPLTPEEVREQLSKTGGTVFYAAAVEADLDEGLSLPRAALNALRREAVEKITALRTMPISVGVPLFAPVKPKSYEARTPEFTVSLYCLSQLSDALLEQKPAVLYLPAGEAAENSALVADYMARFPDTVFAITLPRILWDAEIAALEEAVQICRGLGIEDALVGNWGLVPLCRDWGLNMRGDFGLNLFNSSTLEAMAGRGFVSAASSFELNFSQIRDLDKPIPLEAILYGRLSMMLTQQCLPKNRAGGCKSCRDCKSSRSCSPGASQLVDRRGEVFPVLPAPGCRSEVFNAKTLFWGDKLEEASALGLWAGRLSFTTETAETCVEVLRRYKGMGDFTPPDFTRGLYARKVE